MIAAIDTNILVSAVGGNGPERQREVVQLIRQLHARSIILPAQVTGELFRVLVRKVGIRPDSARQLVQRFLRDYATAPATPTALNSAMSLSVMSKISIWDAIVLATAAEAGCRMLLSEDMQHGFTWSGVTIVNPLVTPSHWLLESLLTEQTR